jgi:hypothetical protein
VSLPDLDYTALHDRATVEAVDGDGLLFMVDGTDWWADCTSVTLEQKQDYLRSVNGQVLVNQGSWAFHVKAVQSTHQGSLWRLLWAHALELVPVVYAPAGNTAPTPDEPFFTATVQLPSPPPLGGDADVNTTQTFGVTLTIPAGQKPQMITER